MWRSVPMVQLRLLMHKEVAQSSVEELGKESLMEFIDLNATSPLHQRHFVADIKRMNNLERQLRFFHSLVQSEKVDGSFVPHAGAADALRPTHEVEAHFNHLEGELRELKKRHGALERDHRDVVELRLVLQSVSRIFAHAEVLPLLDRAARGDAAPPASVIAGDVLAMAIKLGFVCGTVPTHRVQSFERVLWRALRGNLFMRQEEARDAVLEPATGELVRKHVFVIFYQGEQSREKIRQICAAFNADTYPCPGSHADRVALLQEADERLDELVDVLGASRRHLLEALGDVHGFAAAWTHRIATEKAVYQVLNMCDYDARRQSLVAQGWCAVSNVPRVREALRRATSGSSAPGETIVTVVKSKATPPTHLRTTEFTEAFQGIIDSYGVPSYQEVNPAVLTCVTFPFLFGVMFGDVGHGLVLLLVGAAMVRYADALRRRQRELGEMFGMLFGARHMIVLMGAFAVYCGLLYSECFSVSLPLFLSSFTPRTDTSALALTDSAEVAAARHAALAESVGGGGGGGGGDAADSYYVYSGEPYIFGFDPSWRGAPNEQDFVNSVKRKMAIIFGVTQMSVGILLSALNARHFNRPLDFWCETIPQLLFFWSMFGYLVLLIFLKWLQPLGAPSLITTIIDMFLRPGTCCTDDTRLFNGQDELQRFLFWLVLITVPWMFCVKPYLLWRRHRSRKRTYSRLKHDDGEADEAGGVELAVATPVTADSESESDDGHSTEVGGAGFELSEVIVIQAIHSIEFVLGSISNTASYLRLWALSLAHSQLSTIFWERGFMAAMPYGPVAVFVAFNVWLCCTIGILLGLEALSAFLHALRLHWVEFQGKFFGGTGRPFTPFSFKAVQELATEEREAEGGGTSNEQQIV